MLSPRSFFTKVALSFGLLLGLVFVLSTSSFADPITLGTQQSSPEFFFSGTGGNTIDVTMENCTGGVPPIGVPPCIMADLGSASTNVGSDVSAGTYTFTTDSVHPFTLTSTGGGNFSIVQTGTINFLYNATSGTNGFGTVIGTVVFTSATNDPDPSFPDANDLLGTITITGGTFTREIAEFAPSGIGAITMRLGNHFNLNLLIGTTDSDNSQFDSGLITPAPPPPVTGPCPLTQGFWKNHPNAWPVSSLVIGGVSLTKAQLITILKTAPKGGNAVLILEHQLIAALLDIANGTVASPLVLATIADAQTLLTGKVGTFVASSSALGQQMVVDANILDSFNNGAFSQGCTNDTSPTVRRR